MFKKKSGQVVVYKIIHKKNKKKTMQVAPLSDRECKLSWTTEISPDIFADGIHQGMLVSIEGIKKVI